MTAETPSPTWPTLADIEAAAQVVYRAFAPTPQYRWALLSERLGTDCWVKHENHTPVGAFKIRGGLTFFDALARGGALPREVFSATRGNHGQSIRWAARAQRALHHRRAAWQFAREERRHARALRRHPQRGRGCRRRGLAAAWQQCASLRGQCVGVALTGANVDASVLAGILSNQ